jgi:hypothetical protein
MKSLSCIEPAEERREEADVDLISRVARPGEQRMSMKQHLRGVL